MTVIKMQESRANSGESHLHTFLKGIRLFTDLSDEDIGIFAVSAQIKSYKKGKFLYLEGEKADFFYILCNGWVKLSRNTAEGEEVTPVLPCHQR